jgi:hypothetical protein
MVTMLEIIGIVIKKSAADWRRLVDQATHRIRH